MFTGKRVVIIAGIVLLVLLGVVMSGLMVRFAPCEQPTGAMSCFLSGGTVLYGQYDGVMSETCFARNWRNDGEKTCKNDGECAGYCIGGHGVGHCTSYGKMIKACKSGHVLDAPI